ncbi:MAG: hypothetical protein OXG15_11310 [Gammaproteobacteria bacterium]|nr:hypothetical protein [Gammaproteobacteria bacterium]
MSTWFEENDFCLHTLPADFKCAKCALQVDETSEVEPQRTIDKDGREEAYPEIKVDLEERVTNYVTHFFISIDH